MLDCLRQEIYQKMLLKINKKSILEDVEYDF
jgi:hypothetical protein